MQYLLGFADYFSKSPFDPSRTLHIWRGLLEKDINQINDVIAERNKALNTKAISSLQDDGHCNNPGADAVNQISLGDFVKPADWP
jgi:hypothetical protein